MLILLDHPDLYICSRENVFASRLLQDRSASIGRIFAPSGDQQERRQL
jgi:hypothetical protein